MYKTLYHVWCPLNEIDWFFDKYSDAKKAYKAMIIDFGEARLYQEDYDTEEDYEDGIPSNENCLLSTGE